MYTYQNFNILITHIKDQHYLARVIKSPAGEAKAEFTCPSALLHNQSQLHSPHTTTSSRSIRLPDANENKPYRLDTKQLGALLYDHVFQKDVENVFQRSLEIVKNKGEGLRIRLYLSDTPELMNIPWECLYDKSIDHFFALSIQTPIVRYISLENSTEPHEIDLPLNILVMIANPSNYPQLNVEKEWQELKSELSELVENGQVAITRLESATQESLQTELRQKEYHIFHFIGHGDFEEKSDQGMLILEHKEGNEGKRGQVVSATSIGTLLKDESTIKLAILNACEGGKTSNSNAFSGVSQSFIRRGIPAVIAMQQAITDQTALLFSRGLYGLLAEGYPVDTALAEVRKSIFTSSSHTSSNNEEWATPVLYLRTDTGEIIKSSKTIKKTPPATKLDDTPFILVSPNYFSDDIKITRHTMNKEKLTILFKKWTKKRSSLWPLSITSELITPELKEVYIPIFSFQAYASANYKAKIAKTIKKNIKCSVCNGTGGANSSEDNTSEIASSKSSNCKKCKGRGEVKEEIVEAYEQILGEISTFIDTEKQSFSNTNKGCVLEKFKPGLSFSSAKDKKIVSNIDGKEALINSVIESSVNNSKDLNLDYDNKLSAELFKKGKRKCEKSTNIVKEFDITNIKMGMESSTVWLYPILLGQYSYKEERLTVLVDTLSEELLIQKPKEVRLILKKRKKLIWSAVFLLIGLVFFFFVFWEPLVNLVR